MLSGLGQGLVVIDFELPGREGTGSEMSKKKKKEEEARKSSVGFLGSQ